MEQRAAGSTLSRRVLKVLAYLGLCIDYVPAYGRSPVRQQELGIPGKPNNYTSRGGADRKIASSRRAPRIHIHVRTYKRAGPAGGAAVVYCHEQAACSLEKPCTF